MFPRTKALGVLIRGRQILVERFEGAHSKGAGVYFRPIGGTIEFGEYSRQTIVREYFEELSVEIKIIRYLECLENIYRIGDAIGHEITQLYLVEFANRDEYSNDRFVVTDGNISSEAHWVEIDDFITNRKVIYPNGIEDLLLKLKSI
ncbi:NUDIX hydrolase [uncultured Brevibacillus sp.]|uniref:NUDIX hydrolase n=1 Tax=uncultured Brevibacillus sp. TaxID=169970 RepID=UPI002592DB58|nr:NUDIX domain-containing protein [uncultured Brevibacillus sp.]